MPRQEIIGDIENRRRHTLQKYFAKRTRAHGLCMHPSVPARSPGNGLIRYFKNFCLLNLLFFFNQIQTWTLGFSP